MLPRWSPGRAVLAALLLGISTAPAVCEETPGLADTWIDARADRPEVHKVLVVGIIHDPEVRRRFEDQFVTMLRARHAGSLTSYSIVPDFKADSDPVVIRQKLLERDVDAVATVRFRPLEKTAEADWAGGWRKTLEQPEPIRDYIEAALRAYDPKATSFGVEVTLWIRQEGRPIWAGRFPVEKVETLRKHASEMVRMVVDELQVNKLY